MGLFDTLKVMKDIVSGGIEAFKAGEKLEELIEKIEDDYEDALTSSDKKLLKAYKLAKDAYDDNDDTDKNDTLLGNMEDAQLEFLEAVTENKNLSKSLRKEIRESIDEFKAADNKALESVGEVLSKAAETDEDRAEIRKTLNEHKRK